MQLARYKQFMPDGLYAFINSQDKYGQQADADILTWPEGTINENVEIETRVSSATINRDLKKQEALALVKELPELINVLLQFASSCRRLEQPGPRHGPRRHDDLCHVGGWHDEGVWVY